MSPYRTKVFKARYVESNNTRNHLEAGRLLSNQHQSVFFSFLDDTILLTHNLLQLIMSGTPRLNVFELPSHEQFGGQTVISANLRLITRLESYLPSKYEPLTDARGGMTEADFGIEPVEQYPDAPQVLHLLNWMALFLAHPNHLSTAVAIVEGKDAPEIIVSVGKVKLDRADRAQSQSLQNCLLYAINRHVKHKAAKKAEKEFSDAEYGILLTSIAEKCWTMVSHRLQVLKATIDTAGGFEALVNLWGTTKFGKAKERKAVLRDNLKALHTTPALVEGDSVDTRLKCLLAAVCACKALVDPRIIPKLDDNTWTANVPYATHKALDSLYQGIYSIYDYHLATTELVSKGIALLIRHIPAERLSEGLKIIWTRDVFGMSLHSERTWEMSPEEWLNKFLPKSPEFPYCQVRDEAHKAKLLQHCAGFWTAGERISAHVHPEIELLFYLVGKGKDALCDTIGSDSELCFMCGVFFDRVNDLQRVLWTTRWGSPNKVEEDWLLPPVGRQHDSRMSQWWARNAGLQSGTETRLRVLVPLDAYLKKN